MQTLAWEDQEFINKPENIALRMQMELQRPYQVLRDAGVKSTVSIFGSARISKDNPSNKHLSSYLDMAEEFAFRVTNELSKPTGYTEFCVATGSGFSVMESGNRGAQSAGGKSIGMAIKLPFETKSNDYVDKEYDFLFKFFSLRKFHMCKIAKAVVVFPGGVGTLEEATEVLTLIQTGKMNNMPVLFFGKDFWSIIKVQLQYFKEHGLSSENDFSQVMYTDSVDDGIEYIKKFYNL